MTKKSSKRAWLILGAFVFLLVMPTERAFAYTWMIRHGYTNCATCHVDPSGGSLLTSYGRAQGALIMPTRWDDRSDEEAAAKWGRFLGAVDLPEEVQAGGDFRGMGLFAFQNGNLADKRFILMQADLQLGLHFSRFRAAGSLGVATDGALGSTIVGGEDIRMVSRTHWLGVDLGADNEFMLRVGRMNLPYGLRVIEHTSWIRNATRTDGNAAQQHGVSLSYNGDYLRGEVMVIVGNLQLGPDEYRERGYSAYVEWPAAEKLAVGASSLVTHAQRDASLLTPTWRHAHGAFVRYSPVEWFVLLGEVDMTLYSQPSHNAYGMVAFAQGDFEPIQGLHLIATLELQNRDIGTNYTSFGGWGSVAWFFLPHMDMRVDAVLQSLGTQGNSIFTQALLMQLHAYL